mgnify:CR=1 FL=1
MPTGRLGTTGRSARATPAPRPARAPEAGPPLRLTNPDKTLWPDAGVTKRDLADYYIAVKDAVVPYLKERPLTIYRCPNGLG